MLVDLVMLSKSSMLELSFILFMKKIIPVLSSLQLLQTRQAPKFNKI